MFSFFNKNKSHQKFLVAILFKEKAIKENGKLKFVDDSLLSDLERIKEEMKQGLIFEDSIEKLENWIEVLKEIKKELV